MYIICYFYTMQKYKIFYCSRFKPNNLKKIKYCNLAKLLRELLKTNKKFNLSYHPSTPSGFDCNWGGLSFSTILTPLWGLVVIIGNFNLTLTLS